MSPRRIVSLVAAVVVAVVVGMWLYRSDAEKVRDAAEAIVKGANLGPFELNQALAEHATDDVVITVTDLPEPLVGRGAIVAAASRPTPGGGKLSFRMQRVEVSVEGTNARITAELVATLQLGLSGLSRSRSGVAVFRKEGDRFRLASAEVGGER